MNGNNTMIDMYFTVALPSNNTQKGLCNIIRNLFKYGCSIVLNELLYLDVFS